MMKYTYLGQTQLYGSRIALGLWQAGGDWGAVDEAKETVTIRQAYGFGASERLHRLVLRAHVLIQPSSPPIVFAHAQRRSLGDYAVLSRRVVRFGRSPRTTHEREGHP